MGKKRKAHEYAAAGSATAGRGTDARVVNEIETERATPQVPWSFLTAIDMIPPYAANKLADEFDDVRKGEICFSSFRTR